ncbi:endoplasmic reticulum membrane-associated RNA degradation protein-like [Musca vetustissima]|uniref:endoplasmic reticulum membrane-associated RNA degradation protein-like n=1 Tax=Musca vetustissima TaxID=27455 RepID=UPI002AB61D67|nr:endoplasmic reticulum membrane-associated RNA degradation protein-like [Musca vetustissima]
MLAIFQNTRIPNATHSSYKLDWMGLNSKKCLELLKTEGIEGGKVVENTLLLTSLLENALANVYYTETNGRQPPHLLRDLICTQEIRKVLGEDMVILLKILMGSPNSINIRNVVWHGFPKPYEIPDYYEKVLLTLIHTIGCQIYDYKYSIKERPLVKDFFQPLQYIDNGIKQKIKDINKFKENIEQIDNEFAKEYSQYWFKLCTYYQDEQYIEFIILILPQIELLLRLHYGYINNVDINAKLDEYYITMDTVFETETISQNNDTDKDCNLNKILDFNLYPQFEGTFHLIYDIFLSPNGCRLRDKVSHGEVDLSALNNSQLASVVLHIFLCLLKPLNYTNLNDYESKLHLNGINKKLIQEYHKKLQMFKIDILQNESEITLQEAIITNLSCRRVSIFQRPHKESELMLLIKMTLENIGGTLDNYREAIAIRSTQLAQRELHSKRRKTLEKLQNSLPQIYSTLSQMFESLNKLFNLLQNDHQVVLNEGDKLAKTLRYLKHSRTISENFVKYSHYESNEWIKSLDLCRKFEEFYNKLYLYEHS